MHIWWCTLSYIYWISPRILHHVFCSFDVRYMHVLCNLHAFYTHLTLYTIYISRSFNYSCIFSDLHYPIYIEFHLECFIMFFVHLMWYTCTYCVIYMHSIHIRPFTLYIYQGHSTTHAYLIFYIILHILNFTSYVSSCFL